MTRLVTIILLALVTNHATAAPLRAPRVTGVRLENAFRLPGSNGVGLVVSVAISELTPTSTSDDFVLVLLDTDRRQGQNATLAIRYLDGPSKPWVLLDDPGGSLARAYRGLVDSKAAVVNAGRKMPLTKTGNYELVYFISTDLKQAALAYTPDAVHRPPDARRNLIETFTVPVR